MSNNGRAEQSLDGISLSSSAAHAIKKLKPATAVQEVLMLSAALSLEHPALSEAERASVVFRDEDLYQRYVRETSTGQPSTKADLERERVVLRSAAETKVLTAAKALQQESPGLSDTDAAVLVLARNPALYREYVDTVVIRRQ